MIDAHITITYTHMHTHICTHVWLHMCTHAYQAPYCHVVIVVTSLLRGSCSEKVAGLLSSLQPLECHLFCSRSEAMHEEAVPLGGMEGEGEGEGGYSHYGEFQALMRKWINREVCVCVVLYVILVE